MVHGKLNMLTAKVQGQDSIPPAKGTRLLVGLKWFDGWSLGTT